MTGQKSTQGRKGEERAEMKDKQTNWKVLKVTKGKKLKGIKPEFRLHTHKLLNLTWNKKFWELLVDIVVNI